MMVISEIAAACLVAPQRENTQPYGPIIMCRRETCVWMDVRCFKRCFYCDCCGADLPSKGLRSPLPGSSVMPGQNYTDAFAQNHLNKDARREKR